MLNPDFHEDELIMQATTPKRENLSLEDGGFALKFSRITPPDVSHSQRPP